MAKTRPFNSAISAWFWFIENQHKPPSDEGLCQPVDILKAVERLYKRKLLHIDHIYTLRSYGSKGRAPEPALKEERNAARLWKQAVDRLEVELAGCGIVKRGERRR